LACAVAGRRGVNRDFVLATVKAIEAEDFRDS
jgi:hypothetical protein